MVVNLLTTGMSIQYGNFFKNGNLRASPSLYNLEFNNIKFPEIKDPYTLTRDKIKTLKVVETLAGGVQRTRELHELAFFYDTIARKNYRGDGAKNMYFNPISRISSILYSIQTILNSEDMMCFLTSNPVNTIISRKATGAGIAPLSGDQKNDIESKLNGRGRYGAGMGKAGDVIAIREKSAKSPHFKAHLDSFGLNAPTAWLEVDKDNYTCKMYAEPKREDIDIPVEEQMIVELYSK